jgi:hypothetical protein
VSIAKEKSKNFVIIELEGKIIDLPRLKIKHMVKSGDKIIISIPLEFYKEAFD